MGQKLGDVLQGLSKKGKEAPPYVHTPSQGLGCLGLNACQGSSCLLRWELTHPRSLLTPLSHMLLPGAFQGRVEISAEACEKTQAGDAIPCLWPCSKEQAPRIASAEAGTEPGGKAWMATWGWEICFLSSKAGLLLPSRAEG